MLAGASAISHGGCRARGSSIVQNDRCSRSTHGFAALQGRAKPYLPQICGTIKWRLNNKSAKIRQQAADLIARIALVMKVRGR